MDEPHSREENRRSAHRRIEPLKTTRKQQVYDYIASRGVRGATDNEIVSEMVSRGLSGNGPRARRVELLADHRIREAIGVGPRDGSTVWFTLDNATAREGLAQEHPLFVGNGGQA